LLTQNTLFNPLKEKKIGRRKQDSASRQIKFRNHLSIHRKARQNCSVAEKMMLNEKIQRKRAEAPFLPYS
jgi:hypothetical protein